MFDDGIRTPSDEPGQGQRAHHGGPRTAAAFRRRRWLTWTAPVAAALVLGGGAGAVTAAAVAGGGATTAISTTAGVLASDGFAAVRHHLTHRADLRRAAPGVVQVNQGNAEGSGFVIDRKGGIVTNAHVVSGTGPITVSFSNDDQVPAQRVGLDETTDVALLRVSVPAGALVPLPLGDSSHLTSRWATP